jgi:hypothetical protein
MMGYLTLPQAQPKCNFVLASVVIPASGGLSSNPLHTSYRYRMIGGCEMGHREFVVSPM